MKVKIGWSNGLEWEQKINKKSVVTVFAGVLLAKQSSDFSFTDFFRTPYILEPDVYAEYRNYYNLQRRINKQKKILHNSADFFFGRIETSFAVKNQNFFNLFIIQGWGARRSLGKKIVVDYQVGIIEHFYYDAPPAGGYNGVKLEPTAAFSFSYVF